MTGMPFVENLNDIITGLLQDADLLSPLPKGERGEFAKVQFKLCSTVFQKKN
jgi:hypothetical protein